VSNGFDGIIDLSGADEATEHSLIPAGKYHVVVTDAEYAMSKNNNPMLKLTLQVLDGEYSGCNVFDNIVFTENAKPRLVNALKRLADVEDVSGRLNLNSITWVGKQAIANVKVEENKNEANGQVYVSNKLDWAGYSKPEGFAPVALDAPVSTPKPAAAAASAPAPTQPTPSPAPNGAPKKMPF